MIGGMPELTMGDWNMRQDLADARYSTISDFLEAINAGCINPSANNKRLWRDWGFEESRGSWYGAGCDTGNDVQRKVRDGWPEGRERMNELREKLGTLQARPQDRRRRMVKADMGDVLDIHQVYAGRLDIAWSVPRRRQASGPQRIELCANMLCSGGEHADVLFWRGAAAAILVDLLQNAGYMVRLVVIFGGRVCNYKSEKVSCRITVKDYGSPFDITSTSATIMPGFFRALGHAWIAAHCKGEMSSSGISVEQGIVEPGEVLLSHSIRDHGTALAFVNSTIEKINAGQAAA